MKVKVFLSMMLGCAMSVMAQGGYQDGVDYYKAGHYEDAKEILEKTIGNPATDQGIANYYLGAIALHNGDKTSALAFFDKGIAANPDCGLNYIGKGEIELSNGNKSAAEKLFNQGIKTNSKNGALYAEVARAYFNINPVTYAKDITKYIEKADKVAKFKEPAVFVLRGDITTNNPGDAAGQYETAIVTAQEAGLPVSPEAYVKYANVYFRVNPKFAINKLEELNAAMPTSALAQRELAEKYYDNNQLTMAAEQYAKYMNNPNHFQKDEQRFSGLLFFGKKYDQSLDIARKVLAKDPDNFYMQRMVMYNLEALKRYEEALPAAEKFFKTAPADKQNFKDYDTYGAILTALNRAPEAVAVYEKAITLYPDKTELLPALSSAYTDAEQHDKAASTMQKFIEIGNPTTNDYYILARRYMNYGLSLPEGSPERAAAADEGIKAVDIAIAKAPSNGTLYRTKAQLFQVKDGEPNAGAADAYTEMMNAYDKAGQAAERTDAYKAAYMYLGMYYAKNQDMAKARDAYEKVLELDPTNDDLRNYLKTLK